MEKNKKQQRYQRLYKQIKDLFTEAYTPAARMATIVAVLHNKMNGFFWTGFYLLDDKGDLIVGPYQGPLACILLKKHTGVCWAGIDRKETVVVPNVHEFPGHIACDSRSQSEIVVPLRNGAGDIIGVLDVDSKELSTFDETDARELEKILELVYQK
jgi:GAF domain-containing protein